MAAFHFNGRVELLCQTDGPQSQMYLPSDLSRKMCAYLWHGLTYFTKTSLQLPYGEWIWVGGLTDQLEGHQWSPGERQVNRSELYFEVRSNRTVAELKDVCLHIFVLLMLLWEISFIFTIPSFGNPSWLLRLVGATSVLLQSLTPPLLVSCSSFSLALEQR